MELAGEMSEAELLDAVVGLARTLGWKVTHFRPGRTRTGAWVTPIMGDAGFPDVVLAPGEGRMGGRVLAIELKSEKGRVSDEQSAWMQALHGRQLTSGVWRPCDWLEGRIEQALTAL